MENKDFELLFDEKITQTIKGSFDDIIFTDSLKNKIKEEAVKNKSLRMKVIDLLNYEVEIPVGRLGIIAAILMLIPTTFTINEGRKIMKNNINGGNEFMLAENYKTQK